MSGRRARRGGEGIGGGGLTRGAGGLLGLRKLAGVPEQEDLFQAGEDAGQDGHDEGVDGGGQHSPVLIRAGCGAQASELVGQCGVLWVHPSYITNCFLYFKGFLSLDENIFSVWRMAAPLRLPPPKREGREAEAWILRFTQDAVFLLLFVHKKKALLTFFWRASQAW